MPAEGSSYRAKSAPPEGRVAAPQASTASRQPVVAASAGSAHGDQRRDPAAPLPVAPEDKTVISSRPPLAEAALSHALPTQLLGEALVGKQLEHYELLEFVGGGGMGAVFRANDLRLGRIVAVKVLSRDHTDDETIRRFRNEAQSAARLDHPNIARVYYVGEDHGWNFIVFEFIEGINLRDMVEQQGPLELEQALYYVVQIAEALGHSSSRDVVHRDIKPSNVLVTAAGEVKLVDMGLARLHQVESSSDDLTASGVTLGTFDYISPEQARDPRSADVRSDMYSLGCTLYYMLTGQPPFPEGTALQKLLRHNSDDPPDVRSFRPDLHPRISALLGKMLAKRPTQRHQSPADLVAEIVGIGQQLGLASVAQHGHAPAVAIAPSENWTAKLWQIAVAAAALVAGIVLVDVLAPTRDANSNVMLPAKFRQPPADSLPAESPTVASIDKSLPSAQESTASAAAGAKSVAGNDSASAASSPALTPYDTPPQVTSAATIASSSANFPSDEQALAHPPIPFASPTETAIGEEPPTTTTITTPPIVTVPVKPKRLIVAASTPLVPEAETEYAASVAEACDRAAELGLTEIELHWNGERREQPLEVASPRLTLRAAAGFRPTLTFRPRVQVTDRQMIRLAGGSTARLAVQGVELRLELPTDPPADGWALLAISTGQTLDLAECVLTVQDVGLDGQPLHSQVAMIQIQRRRGGETMSMDPSLAMAQQTTIGLTRSIARGAANFIGMADETPLTITWNQGLVATSRRFLETGGSATNPQFYEQIALDLMNVTVACREGFYLLKRGSGKSHQFQVAARSERCVFLIAPDVPLYEMVGLSALPSEEELQAIGEANRFSQTDILFLRVRPAATAEPVQEFPLDQRWSNETRSQVGIPWLRSPTLDRPPHFFTKSDFMLEEGTPVGFDPSLLPTLAAPSPLAFP